MPKKLQLVSWIAFTLFMHFLLPYAALSAHTAEIQASHSPPSRTTKHEDTETILIEELPPHIEVKENELEEIDECELRANMKDENVVENEKKTPYRAIFVCQSRTNCYATPTLLYLMWPVYALTRSIQHLYKHYI